MYVLGKRKSLLFLGEAGGMKIHLGLEENQDRYRSINPVAHTDSDDHWAGYKR